MSDYAEVVIIAGVAIALVLLFAWGWRVEQRYAETKRQFWARIWAMDSDEARVKRLDEVYMAMSRMYSAPAMTFALECRHMARTIEARMTASGGARTDRTIKEDVHA